MRISDWSSDVCSSDLVDRQELPRQAAADPRGHHRPGSRRAGALPPADRRPDQFRPHSKRGDTLMSMHVLSDSLAALLATVSMPGPSQAAAPAAPVTDPAPPEDPALNSEERRVGKESVRT